MATDPLTYPTASALRDCLRTEAATTTFGPVADAVVRFGAAGGALMDGCDCQGETGNGRASVRVALVAPADITGQGQRRAGAIRAQRCASPWIVTYELALVRCWPVPADGRPLPATELDVLAQSFLSDQVALRRAINCCAYLDKHSGVELVNVASIGPSGGCAGSTATIRVQQVRG